MSDEFDDWMRRAFVAAEDGCACAQRDLFSAPSIIRPGQLRRLALHLLGLSGHAPGPLPAGELKAIRGRAEATADALDAGRHGWVARALEDRERLLSALDSALADLAAAGGALADLCSPQSPEANGAYLRGVEDATRRCVGVLRETERKWRTLAGNRTLSDLRQKHCREVADALESAALALERS